MATYTVRKGDNLTAIAKRFGTTASAIYTANKAKVGPDANKIFAGTVLAVPEKAAATKSTPRGAAKKANPSTPPAKPPASTSAGRSRGETYKGAGIGPGGPTKNPTSPRSTTTSRGKQYSERGPSSQSGKGAARGGTAPKPGRKRGTSYKS